MIHNFENFKLLSENGNHNWEMIKVPTDKKFLKDVEKMYEEMIKIYPGLDEPGDVWDIYASTADDQRPYPQIPDEDEDEDEDEYRVSRNRSDVDPFAKRIHAISALDALVKYVQIEYDGEVWEGYELTDFDNDNWKKGEPKDCEDESFCDWTFDDGNVDGDEFHWQIICIKKVEGPNFSQREVQEWNLLPYHIKQKFATEKISMQDFLHKYRGRISSHKFGL